ncbi:sensor histidine kinase [Variovorax paradoxus]|uniref:sensor histidine kinase n=1 Tax=Variovorax paradoxus TaxID=34073 RepID=UPI00155D8904|nr:sensor histidine kinase [Variovorax paradoxus]
MTAIWVFTGACVAWALNPALDISQHGHRAWRDLDGFGLGTVVAIAQTTDGYMWLATPNGVLRFDGVRSVPWRAPAGASLPDTNARALLGTRDGALWIGTLRGLARLKNGALTVFPALAGKAVNAIVEASDGTIWVAGAVLGGDKGVLCAVREGASECHGDDGSLGRSVLGLYQDTSNALWVAGTDRIWKWGGQPEVSYALPVPLYTLESMTGTPDGALVVGTRGGLLRLANGMVETLPLPEWGKDLSVNRVRLDRDGALWLGAADHGLLRLYKGRVDTYTPAQGLSGEQVLATFEDREGSLWVSTSKGLDQFRPMAAAAQTRAQGLKGRARSILAARDGSLWATTTGGVYQMTRPQYWEARHSAPASLLEDRRGAIWMASNAGLGHFEGGRYVAAAGIPAGPVDAMAEDAKGNLWVAHQTAGLFRLSPGREPEPTPWTSIGVSARVSTMAVDSADDSLWLGLWSGDMVNLREGRVRNLAPLQNATQWTRINQLRPEPDGSLWVTNMTGLTRIKNGRAARLDEAGGLPCDRVFWTLVDPHGLWLSAPCGLMRIRREELDAWSAAADRGAQAKVKVQLLDQWDGVRQAVSLSTLSQFLINYNFTPKLARSSDGLVWAVTGDDIVRIDPARLPLNDVPPPVRVEQLVSDDKVYEPRAGLQLPALQHNLAIDYTALSFAVPEKVRFRYKLEGRDTDWHDPGQRRQAFYTDLPPGHYRFRVMAANESGLWNQKGDTLDFSIAPAWWQTNVFRATFVLAVLMILYGLHRLRLAQLSRRFSMSLEARVNERLRIARELHDTLLQTFQGLVLRLQTAHQLMPESEGRRILEEGIDQAADAITEGRDAVQGLRATATETSDLADAVRALGQVLAADPATPSARLGVEVHGRARSLHPIVRDDAFRIVGEALRNAFRHAAPTRVEVEIRYDDRQLSVRVRDDGKGMDPRVVRRGREGHFGLHGMRERAKLIGGALTFWSRLDAGTAVELTVPAARAYATESGGARSEQGGTANDHPADTTSHS